MELGLKILSMSFANWLLTVIAPALGFEGDIRRARHKQYTHTHTHTHTRTSHMASQTSNQLFLVYSFIFTKFVMTTEFQRNRRLNFSLI